MTQLVIFIGLLVFVILGIKGKKNKVDATTSQTGNVTPKSKEAKVAQQIFGVLRKFSVAICAILALLVFINMNSVYVDKNEMKHFNRKFGGEDLPVGHFIATKPMTANPFGGMKGPQPDVFTPGFHFFPLIGVLYEEMDSIEMDVVRTGPKGSVTVRETIDLTTPHIIPPDHFATVSTRDGRPMTDDMILAPGWDDQNDFMDAVTFLTAKDDEGNKLGYRGDQSTLITGGTLFANKILYSFVNYPVEHIKTGEVGVVRSAINEKPAEFCVANRREVVSQQGGVTYLVPEGCAGVWKTKLDPKTYRFHPKVYSITHMPTRQQDFDRKGGYTKESVKFEMKDDGKIQNIISKENVVKPQGAEGEAIDIVVEGWPVPIDLKTKYQIIDAPLAVATIGDFIDDASGLNSIERFLNNPIESTFRIAAQGKDILRCAVYEEDVIQGEGKKAKVIHKAGTYKDHACVEDSRRLFDLINNRTDIEKEALVNLNELVNSFGIGINLQTMGHPNLPIESLIPRMRANYAKQLQNTFKEEEATYIQRRRSEAARVEAEKQDIVVTAALKKQAANDDKIRRETLADARAYELKKEGQGFRDRDTEAAKGQEKLVAVMGIDKVQEQVLFKMAADAAATNPDMVKTATVFVNGGGEGNSGINSAAALLGATSNISQVLKAGQTQNGKTQPQN